MIKKYILNIEDAEVVGDMECEVKLQFLTCISKCKYGGL